jgi:hypothetical protein
MRESSASHPRTSDAALEVVGGGRLGTPALAFVEDAAALDRRPCRRKRDALASSPRL